MSDTMNEAEGRRFLEALLATRYLLGAREDALLQGLDEHAIRSIPLTRGLTSSDRQTRATVLAPHLVRLVQTVERLRL